jgi:KDO2-lipid IV(A) lauroyltransferase
MGAISFAALGRRRDIACSNIRRAQITQDETEVRRIAKASMIHFLQVAMSSLQEASGKKHPFTITENISPEAHAALSSENQGVLLCTGHLGNWEIGLKNIAKKYPIIGIARKMNNPLSNTFMQRRESENIEITPKHDPDAGRLLRALTEGRNLGLLFDQHASGNRGVMVPFFGTPASTYASPAMLHLTTKAPICFCNCIRTGKHSFTLRVDSPVSYQRTGNRKKDTITILEDLHKKLELAIRETPEQYLWSHRRWKATQAPCP